MVEFFSQASDQTLHCPTCGAGNSKAARFCTQCSKPLATAQPSTSVGAERKQVTVLFSDLSGFTALSEKLDPEETRQIMGRVFQSAADIVARYEGRIEKFVGDAIMAIFGAPTAHEDDPQRAVRAALELHEVVARLSPEVEARSGTRIQMHSGVNTGVVITGELQFDHGIAGPLGDTINTAARLMNAAPSCEIWVGAETRRLIAAHFELDDLGAHELKGKAQAVAAWRVRRAHAHELGHEERQLRGAFVGRHAELGALLDAAETMRDGQAQAIGVCGDAGTGKTRLLQEFRARLGPGIPWLEGRCYPYAKDIPYAPLINLLDRAWGIEETDGAARLRGKIEDGLGNLLGTHDDALPLYLHLYHLEQAPGVVIEREAFQPRLLTAMLRVLTQLARRGPTIVCLQDLHWADPSTLALLAQLAVGLPGGLLLLVNYRPGYEPPSNMQTLALGELSPRQTGELLASLLKGEAPAPLVGFVAERTDGNPFYVEEVVNALVETGVLLRAGSGWTLSRPLADAGVPSTIRGVIAARIDRLDESRRRLLRHASVLGREFMATIVALLSEDAADITLDLQQLRDADLIRKRRMDPELEYMFKHALTRDVAYEGLLKTERQSLHARTARIMEGVYADRIPEFVETLAYHWQHAADSDKAVHYLTLAGAKCVERYALAEAENHFRQAYALLPKGERNTLQCRMLTALLNAWAQVHYYQGTAREWRNLLEQHLPEAERCGDPAMLTLYLGWLGNARIFHGDAPGSLQALDRAMELGRAVQARRELSYVVAWRVWTLAEVGRFADAIQAAEEFDQTEDERRVDPYPFFKNQGGLAWALATVGDLRRVRLIAEELIHLGRASGGARAESMGHFCMVLYWFFACDFERAVIAAQAAADTAKDPVFWATGAGYLAFALAGVGRTEEARRCCERLIPDMKRHERQWIAQYLCQSHAMADLGQGSLSKGLRDYRHGLRVISERGYLVGKATADNGLLSIYTGVACGDGKVAFRTLLRNPWFVFTQAPFAARWARALIQRLRVELVERNAAGFMCNVDLCDGRMLLRQGKLLEARQCLDWILSRLQQAGIDHIPAPIAVLVAELEQRARA